MAKIVRAYLIFGGIYMLAEALIHFSGIRLSSVSQNWPQEALSFSTLMSNLYASTCIFLGSLLLFLQTNIEKNKQIIKFVSFYGLFHGSLVIFTGLSGNLERIFKSYPSLFFWIPFYNSYLLLEAFLAIFFAFLVYLWQRK